MRTVHKTTLDLVDGWQGRMLPASAKIVHVGMQYGQPTVWYECDPMQDDRQQDFVVHGTGHPIDDGEEYVGSAVSDQLVWHVYRVL